MILFANAYFWDAGSHPLRLLFASLSTQVLFHKTTPEGFVEIVFDLRMFNIYLNGYDNSLIAR